MRQHAYAPGAGCDGALMPFWNCRNAKTIDFGQIKAKTVVEEPTQSGSVGELYGLRLTIAPDRHIAVHRADPSIVGENADHDPVDHRRCRMGRSEMIARFKIDGFINFEPGHPGVHGLVAELRAQYPLAGIAD